MKKRSDINSGLPEVLLSDFGNRALSAIRSDDLVERYDIDLGFNNPNGQSASQDPIDVVDIVVRDLGLSRAAATERLSALRISLHDYLVGSGIDGYSDPRVDGSIKYLIYFLDSSDTVLEYLPDERVADLVRWRRG